MSWLHASMKQDWNAMAQKNAFYYVVTHDEFADPKRCDQEQFFDSGKQCVDDILTKWDVPPDPSWSVLEIGSGLGRLTRNLATHYGHVVGLDVSPEMIRLARELTPWLDFREVHGTDLRDFATNSVDMVFSWLVLQHLPRQRLILDYIAAMARVLKPGGLAVFQVPTSFHSRFKRIYWDLIRPRSTDPLREKVSFRGSTLTVGTVQRHAVRYGLHPIIVRDEGSYYTGFKLQKAP